MARRSSSRGKVPGTKGKSYKIPLCSIHKTPTIRGDDERWFCPTCFDEHLRVRLQSNEKSVGGVELPAGVADPRKQQASLTDVLPNHAARRAQRKRFRRGRSQHP
jgi:hypothetical protein